LDVLFDWIMTRANALADIIPEIVLPGFAGYRLISVGTAIVIVIAIEKHDRKRGGNKCEVSIER
jgi:hypothetical protein